MIRVPLVDDDALVRSGLHDARRRREPRRGRRSGGRARGVRRGRPPPAPTSSSWTSACHSSTESLPPACSPRNPTRPPSSCSRPSTPTSSSCALQAGAAGFLLKDTPPAEIVRAIELVHAGDGMLSPTVTRRLISLWPATPTPAPAPSARDRLATLSPREHDVALAVGRGETNAEIAAALHLSVATVKAHVSRLLDKLDVDNRVQIALLVQAAGEH